MQPDWGLILPIIAIAVVSILITYIRLELKRRPIVPRESPVAGAVPSREAHNHQAQATDLPVLYAQRTRRASQMVIYLVTVADKATVGFIEAAIDSGDQLFIGDATSHGPIAEIQEYVNVSD